MNRQITATILKELRQRRWPIISYSLIAFGFLALYISIFPSFQHESAKFDELFQSYPKALLEAFNIEQLQMSTVEGYLSAEHFSFIWPLMAILFGLSTAGVALAGEIERGTMSLLLSLPITRFRLYISKYISGVGAVIIFTTLSTAAIIPIVWVSSLTVNAGHVLLASLLSLCFMLAIFSLGFMVSAMSSERSRVYISIGGLLIFMYVANVVSGLVKSLHSLKYLSFFNYYSPDKALVHGQLNYGSIILFVVVSVIAFTLGLMVFKHRDISV